MKIVITYNAGFPDSSASAEHIVSYSKGLIKLGHEVWILSLQPYVRKDHHSTPLPQVNGTLEGIHYYFPANTIYWPENHYAILKKLFIKFKSFYGSYLFIKKNKPDIVIHYSPKGFECSLWYLICALTKYKFVVERTELPDIYKNQDYYNANLFRRLYKLYIERTFSHPDAWILETKTLQNYYQQFANPKATFHILPMTVETDRFLNIPKDTNQNEEYIAYCGNMREDDGISILITAFSLISSKYPNLTLKLAGYSEDTPKQKELAHQLNIENRITFLGKISRDIIPRLLGNARLLVLASPTSLRSCATMPCKVGEYLCTGIPTVVTGLGEVNNYLTDGENAYLAQPDSAELFAKKMDEALSDSEEKRNKIAKNGLQTAYKYFSADSQSATLIDIIKEIKTNQSL